MQNTENEVNYDEYELAQGVMMNSLDLEGLTPQQKRHAKLKADIANEEGEVVYEIFTDVNPGIKIHPNIDFDLNNMTPEQKEVYEALKANDDDEYEELEDDFILQVNEGIVPMKKKQEALEEIVKATEVEKLEGDQIEMKSFMDIIRKDAALLKINESDVPLVNGKKYSDDEDNNDNNSEIKDTEADAEKTDVHNENQPTDILELMALNKPTKKGMEVVEQRVETIEGGGKLIFRKVKKAKKADKDLEANQKSEIISESFKNDKLDELSFVVDSDGEGITKSELDKLESNYRDLKDKKTASNKYKKSDSDNENSDDNDSSVELEIIKIDGEEFIKYEKKNKKILKTKYTIKNDVVLQRALEDDVEEEEEALNIERPKMKKLNIETCPTAPEDRIKPQNYYCMAVVKEELDVKRKVNSI